MGLPGTSGRTSARLLDGVIAAVATCVAVYHILTAFVIVQGITRHYVTHVGAVVLLLLLLNLREARVARRYVVAGCLLLSVVTTLYMWLAADRLEGRIEFITATDMVMGILVVLPVFVATWLWWGPVIPLMVAAMIVYYLYGHLIPGPLAHAYFSPKFVVSKLTTSLSSGMFGYLTPTSANLVFYFMLFSGVMGGMGVVSSFLEIGKLLGRVLPGGPAYVALVGSSLVAMVQGGGSANVAATGTFTIPAMKQNGFRGFEAAGIEGAVSTGGQITPPVMAAAAFLIAAFLGVPYTDVVIMATLGAVFYYLTHFAAIFILSNSRGLKRSIEPVNTKVVLQRFPIFLVALTTLIVLLLLRFSATYASTAAIGVTLVMALLLVRENRSPAVVIRALAEGAKLGAQIAVVLAIVGMLAETAISTSLAPKMSATIMLLTRGLLIPSLVLVAITTVILGMGLPALAAYLITAVMMIPSLWRLGVDVAASHFFVFYFSSWAAVTPPVAPAAMVASRLAGASLWRTGIMAMKLMAPMFFYPFVVVMHPSLLRLTSLSGGDIGLLALFLVACLLTSIAIFGWFFANVSPLFRGVSVLAALSIMAFVLGASPVLLGFGLVLLSVFVLGQVMRYRAIRQMVKPGEQVGTSI